MKAIVGLLVAAVLADGSGCAKTDWIDRTLVTVDVTGTWEGFARAPVPSGTFRLELDQQGSVVKGFVQSQAAEQVSLERRRGLLQAPWPAMCSASRKREAASKASWR